MNVISSYNWFLTPLISIGLLLATFSSNAQNNRYIKTATYEGIVSPYSPSTGSDDKIYLKYMATNAEIALMEKRITASITEIVEEYKRFAYADQNCDIAKNLTKYKRYYECFNVKGEKTISIYFSRTVPKDWIKTKSIFPATEYCNSFSLEYVVSTGILSWPFPEEYRIYHDIIPNYPN